MADLLYADYILIFSTFYGGFLTIAAQQHFTHRSKAVPEAPGGPALQVWQAFRKHRDGIPLVI